MSATNLTISGVPCLESRPHHDASRLTQRQINLAKFMSSSEDRRSYIAPAYFLFSCFGKLIFGFGASLTVKGVVGEDPTSTIVGGVLCGFGFICILIVAFGFGAACSRIDRTWGIIFKCISITAAILIALGYAINQYYVSAHHSLLDIRLSIFPLFLGAALLTISISNFTAYTELVRGRCPKLPIQHRPFTAMCLIGPGLGTVFAGWITGEKGEWPVAFNAAVLTLAMASLYCGVSIFWSNHLWREAEWAQQCIILETYSAAEKHYGSADTKQIIG